MVSNIKSSNSKKIVLAVVLVLVLGLIFWLAIKNLRNKSGFVSADEIKARTAAIPPAPEKVCERAGDPSFVSQNYSVCCPDGEKTPNCICRLPGIKSCQQKYKECLDGKLFSEESTQFLGKDNMPAICQKMMAGCFTKGTTKTNNNPPNPVAGMKPDLDSTTNNICQVDGYKSDDLAVFCGQVCQQIPGCQYYQTNELMGSCGLFKGEPVPLEKGAAASTMGNFNLYRKQEGFADTEQKIGQAQQFCLSGAVDKCSSKTARDCLCTHSVIEDCQKIHQNCLSKPGETKDTCQQQFGTCCGLIDSADPNTSASMSKDGKIGSGRQDSILCRPSNINSLAECKAACLQNTKCKFINSNLSDAGGVGTERKGLTVDGKAPFCQLFKGDPLPGGMLGLQNSSGKTIYMKQAGNSDEREVEDALSKK